MADIKRHQGQEDTNRKQKINRDGMLSWTPGALIFSLVNNF